jgi:hypothetical protein
MSWTVVEPGWQAGSFGVTAQSSGGVTVTGGAFGVGAPAVKSAALLPVLDAVALRWADVEFVIPDTGATSDSLLVPKPTKSTTLTPPEQEDPQPVIAAVLFFTSATFPVVALRLIDPVMSADGRGAPTLPPLASWTKKKAPGAIEPERGVTPLQVVRFVAEPYCTDQPVRSMGAAPLL